MSVDLRTRADGPGEAFDPARFFDHDLPGALDAGTTRWRPGPGGSPSGR